MKKALAVFFALALFLVSFSVGGGVVSAADPQEGGLYYQVVGGNATITGFIRSYKPTAIPSTIGGYPVTAIGAAALSGCTTMTSVKIPGSVKTIGRNAFGSCTALTSVTVSSGTTAIEGGAFYGCTKLTSISLSDSITSIGSQAFYNTAYYDAPANWTGSILYIGNHVADAKSWASGNQIVRAGTKTIAEASFYGCADMASVSLPDGLVTIGKQAFQNCESLTGVSVPDSVKTIGDQAFYGCEGLLSIAIPNGVETIGAEAFSGCSAAQSLTLPTSVTSIGEKAFAYGHSLTFIAVAQGNPTYHSVGNCLIETASGTLLTGCRNSTIPKDGSVTRIASYAFAGQKSLAVFSIPDTVTHVLGYAFYACSTLSQISVPASVSFIGGYAFDGCTALADVYYGGAKGAWETLVRAESSTSPLKTARVHYNTLVPHWELDEVIDAPTCTENGLGRYSCDCGHTLNQLIAATGHPAYMPIETVEPTCSTVGYTVYRCVACDHSYHADFVGTSHSFEEGVCVWCGKTVKECLSALRPPIGEQSWVVRQSGAVKLELTFSEDTVLAEGDAISIYDGQEEPVGTYVGDELAGETVIVIGNTATICMSVQSEASESGFAVEQLTPVAPSQGDLNLDAIIDMNDAFALYRVASGVVEADGTQAPLADMNADGAIDMMDAFAVYRIASGA